MPMFIRLGYELVFDLPAPTPIMFLLYLHPSRDPTLRQGDRLTVEPHVRIHEFIDVFGKEVLPELRLNGATLTAAEGAQPVGAASQGG